MLGLAGAAIVFFVCAFRADTQVRERFQGRVWELPAKVYARPLQLYPGMALVPDLFEEELKFLGYRRETFAKDLKDPGRYCRTGDTFDLFCRAFDFGDEARPARRTRIIIQKGQVTALTLPDGREREDERLDPVFLGGFYPGSMEDRVLVTLAGIPDLLGKTIVAVEDRNFYAHHGIDLKSIFRAIFVDLKTRSFSQGGSTLTQQLAKNFFLSREKSLIRKINELFVAGILERRFTKDEILEAYLNEVYLGQDGNRAIHGFGLAADFYFGKSLDRLGPGEIALLVGMLKGPSFYNPRQSPDRAKARRNLVLELMKEQDLISPALMEKARSAPLNVVPKPAPGHHSPFSYYLDLIKRQLLKEYREADLRTMGLRIFTALDPQVQVAAEQGTAGFMKNRDKNLEAGVVVTSRTSNEIQAVVGGKAFRAGGFNRALDVRRPIGSLVKPAVYLTALAQPDRYTVVTPVSDGPLTVKLADNRTWQPKNYDRQYHGTIPLYQALVHSFNVSTVRLGMDLGLVRVADTLGKLGQAPEKPYLPSMLLGSVDMSPIQVAQVYHTLASGGFYTPARAILAVYTPEGSPLRRYPLTVTQTVDPAPVFLMNKLLQAVVARGTGKNLEQWLAPGMGIAGKTGTSSDLRDSWFAGFSGSRLAVVWIGRDDNTSCGLTGATGALQVFGRVMSRIPNIPLNPAVPESIEWGAVTPDTGQLTRDDCPTAYAMPFIKGSKPPETGSCRAVPGKPNSGHFFDWLKKVFR